jgi:putative ABC transport system substrate-binding protein
MQFGQLKRREFISLLGGTAAWPLAARAQQPAKLPTIGYLGPATPSAWGPWTAAFVQRLRELGWIEGRTVTIEYRWAEGHNERYAEIAAEFVRLIQSLVRPGGNVTGLSIQQTDTAGKRLELLREVVPSLRRLAIMANVSFPDAVMEMREVQETARAFNLEVSTFEIRRAEDIAPAFEALKGRAEALYVASDPLLGSNRVRIGILALGARLPTMHDFRDYVEAGGLMSYGPNNANLFRRAGDYVDKILRGAKPADIPVEQPTKFDLVVNLITAQALGLTVPPTLLARADEVKE